MYLEKPQSIFEIDNDVEKDLTFQSDSSSTYNTESAIK
jgi:hypothetical protein